MCRFGGFEHVTNGGLVYPLPKGCRLHGEDIAECLRRALLAATLRSPFTLFEACDP